MLAEITPGKLHYGLPMPIYLAHAGIGSSLLRNILRTPADFKAARSKPNEETAATIFGTAVHTAVLEPDEFPLRYLITLEDWGPLNKNPGKKKWDELKALAEAGSKIALNYKDTIRVMETVAATIKVPEVQMLLEMGRTEVTAVTSDAMGFSLKARADLLSVTLDGLAECVWDLKTTSESLEDDNLANIIINGGYHFQAAHHLNVLNTVIDDFDDDHKPIENWGWIFVSTQSPATHVRLVQAPRELLAYGFRDHNLALHKLLHCVAKDHWPGYETVAPPLVIPERFKRVYE